MMSVVVLKNTVRTNHSAGKNCEAESYARDFAQLFLQVGTWKYSCSSKLCFTIFQFHLTFNTPMKFPPVHMTRRAHFRSICILNRTPPLVEHNHRIFLKLLINLSGCIVFGSNERFCTNWAIFVFVEALRAQRMLATTIALTFFEVIWK